MSDSALKRYRIAVLLLLGYLLFVAVSYSAGRIAAFKTEDRALRLMQDQERFELELATEVSRLKRQLMFYQQHIALEQQALELVREKNRTLQDQVMQLKERLSLYQQAMQPQQGAENLSPLGKVKVE